MSPSLRPGGFGPTRLKQLRRSKRRAIRRSVLGWMLCVAATVAATLALRGPARDPVHGDADVARRAGAGLGAVLSLSGRV